MEEGGAGRRAAIFKERALEGTFKECPLKKHWEKSGNENGGNTLGGNCIGSVLLSQFTRSTERGDEEFTK